MEGEEIERLVVSILESETKYDAATTENLAEDLEKVNQESSSSAITSDTCGDDDYSDLGDDTASIVSQLSSAFEVESNYSEDEDGEDPGFADDDESDEALSVSKGHAPANLAEQSNVNKDKNSPEIARQGQGL